MTRIFSKDEDPYNPKTPEDILVQGNEDYTGADLVRMLDEAGYRVEAKDANNPEEYMRGFEDGRNAGWQEKGQAFFSAPASIRIEALRAAVQLTSGVVTALGPTGEWEASPASLVINYAEQFAAWLESGQK